MIYIIFFLDFGLKFSLTTKGRRVVDESMLVQQAIKWVSEGKVSEEQAYSLIGIGLLIDTRLSRREDISFIRPFQAFQEEERKDVSLEDFSLLRGEGLSLWEEEGRSFWEKHKCKALKIFCKAIQEGSRLEQALHAVFMYFFGRFGLAVAIGLIYAILLKGAQALCELLSKDCEEKKEV
jgi:hypothetical protein